MKWLETKAVGVIKKMLYMNRFMKVHHIR